MTCIPFASETGRKHGNILLYEDSCDINSYAEISISEITRETTHLFDNCLRGEYSLTFNTGEGVPCHYFLADHNISSLTFWGPQILIPMFWRPQILLSIPGTPIIVLNDFNLSFLIF